jgi:hypothetical protein
MIVFGSMVSSEREVVEPGFFGFCGRAGPLANSASRSSSVGARSTNIVETVSEPATLEA